MYTCTFVSKLQDTCTHMCMHVHVTGVYKTGPHRGAVGLVGAGKYMYM